MGNVVSINGHKPLVKVEAVAQYLGCSKMHVLRMARSGKIPCRKINNGTRCHWRFDMDEVVNACGQDKATA